MGCAQTEGHGSNGVAAASAGSRAATAAAEDDEDDDDEDESEDGDEGLLAWGRTRDLLHACIATHLSSPGSDE